MSTARRALAEAADVAEFYGFDASQLSPFVLEGYRQNVPRLAARRKRRELELRPDVQLTPDGLYELILAETGDETHAQEEASRYAWSLTTPPS